MVKVEEDVNVVKELKGRDKVHPRFIVRVCEIFAKSSISKESFQDI